MMEKTQMADRLLMTLIILLLILRPSQTSLSKRARIGVLIFCIVSACIALMVLIND